MAGITSAGVGYDVDVVDDDNNVGSAAMTPPNSRAMSWTLPSMSASPGLGAPPHPPPNHLKDDAVVVVLAAFSLANRACAASAAFLAVSNSMSTGGANLDPGDFMPAAAVGAAGVMADCCCIVAMNCSARLAACSASFLADADDADDGLGGAVNPGVGALPSVILCVVTCGGLGMKVAAGGVISLAAPATRAPPTLIPRVRRLMTLVVPADPKVTPAPATGAA